MALSTALYTGLSGLAAASRMISVSGNNIANVNTTAYKSTRADFETQISQSLKNATAPTANLGGTNPAQVGLGVRLAAISRNFNNGAIQPTGVNTDVALEGKGFFVLNVNGQRLYTRSGSFDLDGNFDLVSKSNGGKVQGYGVDANFNIIQGVMRDVNIPLGSLTIAEPTREVVFKGNLNAAGEVASHGTIIQSTPMYADAAATTALQAADALTSAFNATGAQLFQVGDVITISGITKGTASLPTFRFEVTDAGSPDTTTADNLDGHGATMQDFLDFMDHLLGIETFAGEGVTIDPSGQMVITGNTGELNHLTFLSANMVVNKGSLGASQPLLFTQTQEATGESVRTTFVSYDSLGNEVVVDLTMVLEEKNNAGTVWRYYAQSNDDTDLDRVLGSGLVNFDTAGRFVSTAGGDSVIRIDRQDIGADTPQDVRLVFANEDVAISSLADTFSEISAVHQDGFPIGTLEDFSISEDGTIVGVFSNSLLRNLGQVVLATFANPGGLTEIGGNMYNVSPASGTPTIVTPGNGGAGRTIGSALEGSNVDLSGEFINLISASTGFSASSRVLTTSNQLIQELLSAVR